MKKFVIALLIALLAVFCSISAFAEETVVDDTEQVAAETQTDEQTEPSASRIYAEQLAEYVFSGADGSAELMDRIIAIGEQYKAAKEEGYSLEERIAQLVTPENIVTTVAAAFLALCGISFFVIEQRRKRDSRALCAYVSELERKYTDEIDSNAGLKVQIERQGEDIAEMKSVLCTLAEGASVTKGEAERIAHSASAVADMVKDVFLNSKTLSADAKELMLHNYMKAFGSGEAEKNE